MGMPQLRVPSKYNAQNCAEAVAVEAAKIAIEIAMRFIAGSVRPMARGHNPVKPDRPRCGPYTVAIVEAAGSSCRCNFVQARAGCDKCNIRCYDCLLGTGEHCRCCAPSVWASRPLLR